MGNLEQNTVPQISPFQYGSNRDGMIKENVNLFRSAVSFQLPILSLPENNGVGISISATYQSDINRRITHNNQVQPTGILGLGWHMEYERIICEEQGEDIDTLKNFVLTDGISESSLKRTDRVWKRGILSNEIYDELNRLSEQSGNEFVLKEVSIEMGEQETLLDENAKIQQLRSNQWYVRDDSNQFTLLLSYEDGKLWVYDGGIAYENSNFDFSRISYYQEYKKWLVVTSEGIQKEYGSNALQYGVCWNGWSGNSALTSDSMGNPVQQNYIKAWNLVRVRSPWCDELTYSYDMVEQPVGKTGLSYTKACYLSQIRDQYGYKVFYEYGEKEYNTNSKQAPREYADPHKCNPDNTADAYQTCYETRYLSSISCCTDDGNLLKKITFSYTLNNYQKNAYLDTPSLALGDYYKRQLTKMKVTYADGQESRVTEFYYNSNSDCNPGALKQIIYPEGASVSYDYAKTELPSCSKRVVDINRPTKEAIPKVWFGMDYVVCGWQTDKDCHITVYTWLGRWQKWNLKEDFQNIDGDSLEVYTRQKYFILKALTKNGQSTVYKVLHMNTHVIGGWVEDDMQTIMSDKVAITCCDEFFVVNDSESRWYQMISWKERFLQWRKEECITYSESRRQYFTSCQNRIMHLDYDYDTSAEYKNNTLTLYGYEEISGIIKLAKTQANDLFFRGDRKETLFEWSLSGNHLAFAGVTDLFDHGFRYCLYLYTIAFEKDTCQICVPRKEIQICKKGGVYDIAHSVWAPTIIDNSMVIVNGYLYRYNGHTWLLNKNLREQLNQEETSQSIYACGSDCVIKTEFTDNQVLGQVLFYMPNVDIENWTDDAITIQRKQGAIEENRYQPSANGTLLTWDRQIFLINEDGTQAQSMKAPIYTLPEQAITTSVLNGNPCFMAVMQKDGTQNGSTTAYVLEDSHFKYKENLQEAFHYLENENYTELQKMGVGGYGSFYTYCLNADNEIEKVRLYHFSGDHVQKPVESYQVIRSKINDGIQEIVYEYEYSKEQAVCDPSGQFIRYYQSRVYPIVKGKRSSGYTQYEYCNSLAMVSPDENPTISSDIDGQLICTKVYDAKDTLISALSCTYTVSNTVKNVLTKQMEQIYGRYLLHSTATRIMDGVSTTIEYDFLNTNGELTVTKRPNCNGEGKEEIHREIHSYAHEEEPILYYSNRIKEKRRTTKEVTTEKNTSVIEETLVSYDSYETEWENGVYKVMAAKLTSGLTGDLNEQGEAIYRLKSNVISRNRYGCITMQESPKDMYTSRLYDRYEQNIIAEFEMASIENGEAFYYGFEDYEKDSACWKPKSSLPINYDISHTGTCCLQWGGGKSIPSITLQVTPRHKEYFFGFWCYTDNKQENLPQVILTINDQMGSQTESITIPDAPEWQFCGKQFTLKGQAVITIEFQEYTDGVIYLDNLYFSVADISPKFYVYDKSRSLLLHTINSYHQCRDIIYDEQKRQIAQVDNERTTIQLQLLNQVNSNEKQMNSVLYAKARKESYYERFFHANNLATRWSFSNDSGFYSKSGSLYHTKESKDCILYRDLTQQESYFAYVMIHEVSELAGVQVSKGISITWDAKELQWVLSDNTNNRTLTNSKIGFSKEWFILCGERVLLLANKEIIFDYTVSSKEDRCFGLLAKGNARFLSVYLGKEPQIGLQYYDLCGKLRQGICLEDDKITVTEIQYDAMGRVMLHSKPASFEDKKDGTCLWYRDNFITSFDEDSGILTGDLATYYEEDQGYPYVRQRYEDNPTGRICEKGVAGKVFSIVNLSKTTENERHTTKIHYKNFSDCSIKDVLSLPKDKYRMQITIDGDNKEQMEITDQLGNKVATIAAGTNNEESIITRYNIQYAKDSVKYIQILPNGFERIQVKNLLGETIMKSEVNSGTTRFLYDSRGNLRFIQDQQMHATGICRYEKWDSFGRSVENGMVSINDEFMKLEKYVDLADWPSKEEGATVLQLKEYGSFEKHPEQLGNLTKIQQYSETDDYRNGCSMEYDDRNRIRTYITNVSNEKEGQVFKQSYEYDNLDNLTKTIYASGYAVTYDYDKIGRLVRISDDSDIICQYTYNERDLVTSCSYGTKDNFTTKYQYNSVGWITHISNPYFDEKLVYNTSESIGPFDGKISYVSYHLKGIDSTNNTPAYVTYTLTYDSFGRIKKAICINEETKEVIDPWSIKEIQYDKNGNIQSVALSEETLIYEYGENNDKVSNIKGVEAFTYNENGSVTSSEFHQINEIQYEAATGMAHSVTVNQDTIQYQYNTNGKRLLKQTKDVERLYLRNAKHKTLEEIERKANGTSHTEYIYGPYGMTAMRKDKKMHYLCLDHLGSARVCIDTDEEIKNALQYSAFGDRSDLKAIEEANELRYSFTGYEWEEELGLYYAVSRYYDPVLKRFLSVDPKLESDSPYVYCNNNPFLLNDPNGESSWWAILIGSILSIAIGIVTCGAGVAVGAAVSGATVAASATVSTIAGIAAGAAVGAVGGAVAEVVGSTVTAAIDAEPITASMLLSSFASGVIGGGITGGFGGAFKATNGFAKEITKSVIGAATGSVVAGTTAGAINGELGDPGTWLDIGVGALLDMGASAISTSIDVKLNNANSKPSMADMYKTEGLKTPVSLAVSGIKTTESLIRDTGSDESKSNNHESNNQSSSNNTNEMNLAVPVKLLTCFQGVYNQDALSGKHFCNTVEESLFTFSKG
jgi:large repetitive protein